MDLWIRTQDKRQLLKVNDGLYIANGFTDTDIFTDDIFIGIKNVGHVGRYTEEERALEILNEIHQRLIDIQSLEIMGEATSEMKKRGIDCVYEMPKEKI